MNFSIETLVFASGILFGLCCVFLPAARLFEIHGGPRGAWLKLPVGLRLRALRVIRRIFTNYVRTL